MVVRPNPAKVREFVEPAAIYAASKVESVSLSLPSGLAAGPIESSFISTGVPPKEGTPPIIILHSFDSSCLEWRRVLPLLEEMGLEAYMLDILGWGFTDTTNAQTVGVEAKREHLRAFWTQHLGGRAAMLVGSSLGAATIIDYASVLPAAVDAVVLCDPQGFIDGTPPVPAVAARAGIRLLSSWPLRSLGQKLAYEDGERCDTDDAIRVGRAHCCRQGWEDDSIEWLLGGGYRVSHLVPCLAKKRCLVLWGRQDRVLPPAANVPNFIRALPTAQFRWVEECGHVPHLEQPAVTAAAIHAFLCARDVGGDSDVGSLMALSQSPTERLSSFLDRPILDTSVRGGPLEPFKRYARREPEVAQLIASVVALSTFALIGKVLVALVLGLSHN